MVLNTRRVRFVSSFYGTEVLQTYGYYAWLGDNLNFNNMHSNQIEVSCLTMTGIYDTLCMNLI